MKKWRAGERGTNSPLIPKICHVREQILPSFALALLKVCLHMSMIRGKFSPWFSTFLFYVGIVNAAILLPPLVTRQFQNSFQQETKEETSPATTAVVVALPHRSQCIMMQQRHGAAGHVVCGNAGMQWDFFWCGGRPCDGPNVICVVETDAIATDDRRRDRERRRGP